MSVTTFRRLRLLLIMLVQVVFLSAACFAQSGGVVGAIAGTIRDSGGHALSAAVVTLAAEGNDARLQTVSTDADGRYTFSGITYGHYTVTAALNGFHPSRVPLSLTSANAIVDLTLTPLFQARGTGSLGNDGTGGANKSGLSFHPSGAQGTIAPSGYSAGAMATDNSRVMDSLPGLDDDDSGFVGAGESIPGCNQESALIQASELSPSGFEANHRLGVFYLAHGDFLRSIHSLESAAQIEPSNFANSRELAIAYLGASRFPDAIALLRQLGERRVSDPALHRLLAKAYLASGNTESAIGEYRKAAAMDGGEQNAFACGIGLIEAGAVDEAAKIFSAAAEAHPASARIWMGLGVAQALEQQKAPAIRSLLRAADLDPAYLPTYSFLASLSGTAEESDVQIRKRLEALVVSSPESAEPHYDYALALWKEAMRAHDSHPEMEIEAQLKLAIAKDPALARAYLLLGVIYADAGDSSKAVPALEDAARLAPDNAEIHYRLAQAYRRNQQTGLADQEMKTFVAMHGRPAERDIAPIDFHQLTRQKAGSTDASVPCGKANR